MTKVFNGAGISSTRIQESVMIKQRMTADDREQMAKAKAKHAHKAAKRGAA